MKNIQNGRKSKEGNVVSKSKNNREAGLNIRFSFYACKNMIQEICCRIETGKYNFKSQNQKDKDDASSLEALFKQYEKRYIFL